MTTSPDMTAPRTGFLLQLSGPLQSWGISSRFPTQRDTASVPTRSALIGLVAAALGYQREDERLTELQTLRFTVRTDRPGTLIRDLHTVGGGMPRHLTVATAEGKRRSADTSTLVSHRYYLQDAAFTVSVHSTDTPLLDRCAHALRHPVWPPYLGRRSCPPNAPLLLAESDDTRRELLRLPLARRKPSFRERPESDGEPATVSVDFTADTPLEDLPGLAQQLVAQPSKPRARDGDIGEIQDHPVSFSPSDRRYRTRKLHRATVRLPAGQCGGLGAQYVNKLAEHLRSTPREEP